MAGTARGDKMIEMSLANLDGGALEERFQYELKKVIKNIQDPNTDAEAKRTISISISLQPFKGNRDICGYMVSCSSKLGKDSPLEGFITNGMDPITGEIEVCEHRPRQANLFESPAAKKIIQAAQKLSGMKINEEN
ncbi:MAG: hypothetical protein ACOYB1_18300 [Limnohabitans sp.]